MNLMKCPNGHHYDASRFSSCPFCGMEGVNVGPGSDDGSFGRPGVSAGSQRSD